MRIAIIAPGSQGDVEPYLALGKGLRRLRAPVNGLACRPRQRAADLVLGSIQKEMESPGQLRW